MKLLTFILLATILVFAATESRTRTRARPRYDDSDNGRDRYDDSRDGRDRYDDSRDAPNRYGESDGRDREFGDNTNAHTEFPEDTEDFDPTNDEPTESTEDSGSSDGSFSSQCVAAHAKHRSPLGIPGLTWSSTLAKAAQAWADNIARKRISSHSPNRNHVGENIGWKSSNNVDPEVFIDSWASEKRYFVAGRNYPDCSSTGNKNDVGHYTQLIWRDTKEVGCGTTESNGRRYFVCQYAPSGNWINKPVY